MKRVSKGAKNYNELDSDDEDGILQDSGSDYEDDRKKKRAKLGIIDDSDSDVDFGEKNEKEVISKPSLPPKPSLSTIQQKIIKQTPSVSSFFQKFSENKQDHSSKMWVFTRFSPLLYSVVLSLCNLKVNLDK